MPCSLAITPFSMRSSKKAMSSGALGEHRPEDVLDQRLRQRGVVGQIREGDFGLDHPELRQMPAGVRILGAERRAERVDLGQRQAIGLDVELPRHCQERFAAEEILREVDLAVRRTRQVHQVQRRDSKQLTRPFGIRSGDDRRVHPEETVIVEETMDRLRNGVAHARHGADDVGPRAQMRDLAQKFERVRFRLNRIRVRDPRPNPTTLTELACISNGWPLAGEGTITPVASTAQPAVRCCTSSA